MRSILALPIAAVLIAGCASAAPTDGPLADCKADVTHANLNRHDIEALDFAIADCGSLANLRQVVAAHSGYLDSGVTVEQFAANRCLYSKLPQVLDSEVCKELPH